LNTWCILPNSNFSLPYINLVLTFKTKPYYFESITPLIYTICIIQIRPPIDFGPKAQNLEGVRICLRKCGTDIIHSKKWKKETNRWCWKKFIKKIRKNYKKIFRSNFRQNCPKWSPREMALKEITKKILKKILCSNFRQNCPKWSPREMVLKEITKKILKKILRSNFRQNCPKWSPREMALKEITKKITKKYSVLIFAKIVQNGPLERWRWNPKCSPKEMVLWKRSVYCDFFYNYPYHKSFKNLSLQDKIKGPKIFWGTDLNSTLVVTPPSKPQRRPTIVSRNFCQKCVRENSRNFHTALCTSALALIHTGFFFRQTNLSSFFVKLVCICLFECHKKCLHFFNTKKKWAEFWFIKKSKQTEDFMRSVTQP